MIQKELEKYLIIRTDTIYSKERLYNWKYGATDMPCYPTYIIDLCNAIKTLTEKGKNGIIDVTGYEKMNKFEFIKRFSNPDGKPILLEELNLPAKRSKKITSDTNEIKDLGIIMRAIEEARKEIF